MNIIEEYDKLIEEYDELIDEADVAVASLLIACLFGFVAIIAVMVMTV